MFSLDIFAHWDKFTSKTDTGDIFFDPKKIQQLTGEDLYRIYHELDKLAQAGKLISALFVTCNECGTSFLTKNTLTAIPCPCCGTFLTPLMLKKGIVVYRQGR